jgi:hypothetical protein
MKEYLIIFSKRPGESKFANKKYECEVKSVGTGRRKQVKALLTDFKLRIEVSTPA